MVRDDDFSRVDTSEFLTRIINQLGRQKANKYFDVVRRWLGGDLGSKITKREFTRHCVRIFGVENVELHNEFIRAIVKNCQSAKVPPTSGRKVDGKIPNGYHRNSMHSLYGDAFPLSPRKGRSPSQRDRKFRDRPSPLGPLGKTPSSTYEDSAPRVVENQSAMDLLSPGSRPPPNEVVSVEDGEEVEQLAESPYFQSRSPVRAPFGVSITKSGSRKTLCNGSLCSLQSLTCQNTGELPDTRSLRSRLKQKLEKEGFSVDMDCVNLLNNGLDVYLKRLIGPCLALAGSRRGVGPGGYSQRPMRTTFASMLDFSVAMELNPQILREDSSIQLEKISLRASENLMES